MMGKAMVNLQDSFLNQVRKENSEIEMVLVNGTHLTGLVRGFDNFTVVVNAAGKQHLVYKHAIAQIVSQRPVQDFSAAAQSQAQAQPQPLREPREQREPREHRPPQPPRPSGERPNRPEAAPEPRLQAAPEPRPQAAPRPNRPEQPQAPRNKFNVLDLSEVKLDQDKS